MNKASILGKIKELFSAEEYSFADYKTADGRIIRCKSDSLDVGSELVEITADGEVPLTDGEYTLEDGLVLEVEGSKVIEMKSSEESISEEDMGYKNKEEEMEDEYKNQIDTKLVDGTEIRILSKGEAVSVGDRVLVKDGEEYKTAPEGKHEVEGGLVVYTDAEGNINEIETKETEERDDTKLNEVFSSLEILMNELKSLKDELISVKNENEELKASVNKFAKAPSTEPLKQTVDLRKTTKEDKLKFFGNR